MGEASGICPNLAQHQLNDLWAARTRKVKGHQFSCPIYPGKGKSYILCKIVPSQPGRCTQHGMHLADVEECSQPTTSSVERCGDPSPLDRMQSLFTLERKSWPRVGLKGPRFVAACNSRLWHEMITPTGEINWNMTC